MHVLSGIVCDLCKQRYSVFKLCKEMKENLSKMYYKSVSTSTISRHLHEYGY